MSYDTQLDVFGNSTAIIPGDHVAATPTLFDCIDLDDLTYGGTVEQPTLAGDLLARPATIVMHRRELVGRVIA